MERRAFPLLRVELPSQYDSLDDGCLVEGADANLAFAKPQSSSRWSNSKQSIQFGWTSAVGSTNCNLFPCTS